MQEKHINSVQVTNPCLNIRNLPNTTVKLDVAPETPDSGLALWNRADHRRPDNQSLRRRFGVIQLHWRNQPIISFRMLCWRVQSGGWAVGCADVVKKEKQVYFVVVLLGTELTHF